MAIYSLNEAQKRFGKLVDRALAGEEVFISREGSPLVELKVIPRQIDESCRDVSRSKK